MHIACIKFQYQSQAAGTYYKTIRVSTVSIYTIYETLVTTQGTGDMGLVCKLGQQRRSDVTVTEREETEMVGNTK